MPSYDSKTTATQVANDLSSNIKGKTILITGVAPNSLGAHFLSVVASHDPKLIILASRTQSKIDETITSLRKTSPGINLKSVRSASDEILRLQKDEGITIDVLLLNAGIMAVDYSTTEDGFENQFGTNHLGHFVFANRIIPSMLGSNKTPRVVVVASDGHLLGPIRWADPHFSSGQVYDRWRAYGQSKTANCLYALSLAKKLGGKGLQAYSLHPGAINTNLGTHLDFQGGEFGRLQKAFEVMGVKQGFAKHWEETPFKNLEEGTATHIVAAFADGLGGDNGKYLEDGRIASEDLVAAWARNEHDAERLWRLSEELTGEKASL